MKKNHELHITFHNPNTRKDAETIAGEFISQAATGVLTRMILDKSNERSENKTYESCSDLDQGIHSKHTPPE